MRGSVEDRISRMHGYAHCLLVAWLTVIELPSRVDEVLTLYEAGSIDKRCYYGVHMTLHA